MSKKSSGVNRKKYPSKTVVDGFANFSARLGVNPRGQFGTEDNLLSRGHYEFNLLTRNRVQLEAAYRGSWIAGAVVDTIAEDMTRAGIEMNTNEGAEDVQTIESEISRLQIWPSTCFGIKMGRLYGGAISVMQIEGQNLDTPIDFENIKEGAFKGLVIYDRWQVYPVLDSIIDVGPEMGLPLFYDIVLGSNLNDPGQEPGGQETKNASGRVRIHHSRCNRHIGIELPFFQAITEMMWGESILERLWDRLIMFDTATASTGSLINRAQLRTVGIDGLREILAGGGEAQEALIAQFEYMRQFQQNEGITLLDKNDVFASTAYSFAGLSDVLIQMGQQISGACNTPLVKLFGQSPAGLSATGDSDIRMYYDYINAQQNAKLRNGMERLLKVIWKSVLGKPLPEDFTFVFTPLWQMSASEKATIAKTNADTIIEAYTEAIVDKATAMKELKQTSGDTGIFTHITDEHVEEAEEEPPAPELNENPDPLGGESNLPIGGGTGDPGEGPTGETNINKRLTVGDRMITKIRDWFSSPDISPAFNPKNPPPSHMSTDQIFKVRSEVSDARKKILEFIK